MVTPVDSSFSSYFQDPAHRTPQTDAVYAAWQNFEFALNNPPGSQPSPVPASAMFQALEALKSALTNLSQSKNAFDQDAYNNHLQGLVAFINTQPFEVDGQTFTLATATSDQANLIEEYFAQNPGVLTSYESYIDNSLKPYSPNS